MREPVLACEGFIVGIIDHGQSLRQAQLEVRRALRETFGAPTAWRVTPLGRAVREYLVTPARAGRTLRPAAAWEQARRLAAHPLVADVEPALRGPGIQPPDPRAALAPGERARPIPSAPHAKKGLFDGAGRPCAATPEWSLDTARVKAAWNFSPARGQGIRIAHPDTGYTTHDEIWSDDPGQNRVIEGFDFVVGDADAVDDLEDGVFESPGHGTATASVIMSDVGGTRPEFVSGVAPRALLAPLRVSTSVSLLSYGRLIQAIDLAIDRGHHVISMSLGGPFPSGALERAVRRAVDAGLIVVAAAGNYWPFVVYPAALPDVVAVAACHCEDGAWRFSSGGPQVDVAAPGESVWVARAQRDGHLLFTVRQGSGSSYGVATVAGVIALWLSHHGRDTLIARYGTPNLARAFRHILVTHGVRTPAGWDTSLFGAGIVDADRLLRASLPSTLPEPHALARPRRASDQAFFSIRRALRGLDEDAVRRALSELPGLRGDQLDLVLDEVGPELAVHVSVDPALRAWLRAAASRAPRRGIAKRRRGPARKLAQTPHVRRMASPRLRRLLSHE